MKLLKALVRFNITQYTETDIVSLVVASFDHLKLRCDWEENLIDFISEKLEELEFFSLAFSGPGVKDL